MVAANLTGTKQTNRARLRLALATCLLLQVHVGAFLVQRHPPAQRLPSSRTRTASSHSTLLEATRINEGAVIGDRIGKGSYGVVHYVTDDARTTQVGKRALTKEEVLNNSTEVEQEQKVARCDYYWRVERHCFQKMMADAKADCIPQYRRSFQDFEGRQWMLFDVVPEAETLGDLMLRDQADHRLHNEHHLYLTSKALGLEETSLTATLDVVISDLLESVAFVHSHSIVHRDIKPNNCLVSNSLKRIVLIDFGSAADLSTAGILNENIGLSDKVAVSPIYAAPEVFVEPSRAQEALKFDCFSVGLLICQLLFQYLEERTESGFRQQLEQADWDLDVWLQTTLQSKVRPVGVGDALQVLQDRPGLWRLLQDLLREDPYYRISAKDAVKRWKKIMKQQQGEDPQFFDGKYLEEIFETTESCEIPAVRALHFVATFDRSKPLGLFLAEADGDEADIDESDVPQWKLATADSLPGDVFVQGVVQDGQADEFEIFEVGDRLNGIGELPFIGGGFEKAVNMLADQPRSAKFVTLHFDRKPITLISEQDFLPIPPILKATRVADQGAWSIQGRRKAQEDAYVLTEVNDAKQRSILLSAVFDGHLGNAASAFLREELPEYIAEAINSPEGTNIVVEGLVERAWNECCESYRVSCASGEDCSAVYDEREGVLMAYTGGKDAVAGSTGIVVAVDQQAGQVAVLNCGDSRSILLDREGNIRFESVDHTPDKEMDRLANGKDQGLDYSIPKCFAGKWRMEVGDYDYAVARSLEGPFATSKGIVSKADVSSWPLQEGNMVLLASDGLWEVFDSSQIARYVATQRTKGMSARDISREVTALAHRNGSSDNISVIILFLD